MISPQKSVIIIGAGIAGLAAGCYGQMNGYSTQIFEMHNLPGGLCTSWRRKGYTFDGCIHYLVGSRPSSDFYDLWAELGAVQNLSLVEHEFVERAIFQDGRQFTLYCEVDRLEAHMKAISPADAGQVEELVDAVRLFSRFEIPWRKPVGLLSAADKVRIGFKLLPFLRSMKRWNRTSLQDFVDQLSSPLLRESLLLMAGTGDAPVLALIMTLAFHNKGDAAFPDGGSLKFASSIRERYRELGGKLHYHARVVEILLEGAGSAQNGPGERYRAVGLRLADGSEHRADYVISAADGRTTIYEMLGGRFLDDEIRRTYDEVPRWQPWVQVSLGVARDLSGEPSPAVYELAEPIRLAHKAQRGLKFRHYCGDPTMAPAGKSVIVVTFEGSDYAYWKELYADPVRYAAEKERVADEVIDRLESYFPGLRDQVEVVDVASPMTYKRYTGNWQGSPMGWKITGFGMGKAMPQTLPGLDNFFMAGQWVEPGGGLPGVARTGRNVVQMLCRQAKRRFETRIG